MPPLFSPVPPTINTSVMATDPRQCLREFFETGRNLGRRPPSFSLRNVQRDIRSARTRLENIQDRAEGAIAAAVRGEFLPGQLLSITNELRCPPTPYASLFSEVLPPKFKFMFFASVTLNPDFYDAFGGRTYEGGEMYWFIKQSGRPNVSYEYEDVNYYNFRQKALRRAVFNPVQIQMYDDLQDSSASFWNTFLRIQSPVTNIGNIERFLEENGMNWGDVNLNQRDLGQIRSSVGEIGSQPNLIYSASTGILPGASNSDLTNQALAGNGYKQIISEINVYHLIDWGQKTVRYQYVNPRINEIIFDELSWENSDPQIIDVTFEYDTFHIHMPQITDEDLIANSTANLYPITPQQDETPIPFVNKGIDKFNTGIQGAIESTGGTLRNVFGNTPGGSRVTPGGGFGGGF